MPTKRQIREIHGDDWYDHPKWYDTLHWPGTTQELDGLERIAERFTHWTQGNTLSLLEPACGTARHLRLAHRRGHRIRGIDNNPNMLRYARTRTLRAASHLGPDHEHPDPFLLADMTDFPTDALNLPPDETPHLAFCLANSVRHIDSDDTMARHIRCVLDAIHPQGVYAVGIGLTVYGVEPPSEDLWKGARGTLAVTQLVNYLPPTPPSRQETVHNHLIAVTPAAESHLRSSYTLTTYDADQWSAVLKQAGAAVLALVDEDGEDVPLAHPDAWRHGWMGYAVFILADATRR